MASKHTQKIDPNDLASGDPARFERLVRRYQSPIFAFAGRMGFTAAESEDLAQEVFIRLWRSREQFDPERSVLSTWLWTIARNAAINRLDYNRRRAPAADAPGETDTAIDNAPEPSALLETHERMRQLAAAVNQLDPQDRLIIALVYVDELDTADAAKVCDCSVGAFRVRLSRTRKRLFERMNHQESVNDETR
ncbi:MAG: RNA polymerase sigma factor [Burkholderiaceae bacterium]